jgi:hypothetical protein
MNYEQIETRYLSEYIDLIFNDPKEWAEMIYELDTPVYWRYCEEANDQKSILLEKIRQSIYLIDDSFSTSPTLDTLYARSMLDYLHFKFEVENIPGYTDNLVLPLLNQALSIKNVSNGIRFTKADIQTTVSYINNLIEWAEQHKTNEDVDALANFADQISEMNPLG